MEILDFKMIKNLFYLRNNENINTFFLIVLNNKKHQNC